MNDYRKDEFGRNAHILINSILLILLLIIVALFIYANLFHYTAHMESDTGAESIYGMVLADNGLIAPESWHASTEKRVISMPNLAAVIYKICGEMNLSAGIACSIFLVVMFLVMLMYYRYVGFDWTAALMAVIIPLVITRNMLFGLKIFALYACYYCPHIICFYLMLYSYVFLVKEKRHNIPLEAITLIASVMLGMQGYRATLMVFLPLMTGEILGKMVQIAKRGYYRWLKLTDLSSLKPSQMEHNFSVTLWIFLCGITNAVVAKFSAPYGNDSSFHLRRACDKLWGNVIPEAIALLDMDKASRAIALLLMIVAAVGFALNFVKPFLRANLFLPWSLLVSMIVISFTNQESSSRYFIMLLFSIGAGCGIAYSLMEKRKVRVVVPLLAIVLSIMSFIADYNTLIRDDKSKFSDEYMLVNEIAEKGYTHGYASFDFADMLTCYSNGEVIVAAIQLDELKATRWLTDETWYPPMLDVGEKCFIISTDYSKALLEYCMAEKGIKSVCNEDIGIYTVYFFDVNPVEW